MSKKGRSQPADQSGTPQRDDRVSDEPAAPGADALRTLHLWQIQAVRDVLFVAAVIAVIWLGYALRAVTVPLLVALMLAYLFEPIIARLSRDPKTSRAAAVGGLLTLIIAVFVLILAIVIPLVVGQSIDLVRDFQRGKIGEQVAVLHQYVPDFLEEEFDGLMEIIPGATEALDAAQGESPSDSTETDDAEAATGPDAAPVAPLTAEDVRDIVRDELDQQATAVDGERDRRLSNIARGGWTAIRAVLGVVIQVGLLLFLIPFYFFFFSLWYPSVVRFGRSLLPEKNKAQTLDLLQKMDRVVSGFIRGRITISFIMGVLFAVGWMICGVPYALLLGMAVGVLSLVPYLSGIGLPIAIALTLVGHFSGDNPMWLGWIGAILWPSLVFGLVQFIEGYVLVPAIAGKATNLDPVTIVVAVLAGGSALGVYGMLLAIPIAACGKIVFVEILMPRIRAWTEGKARDPLPIDRG